MASPALAKTVLAARPSGGRRRAEAPRPVTRYGRGGLRRLTALGLALAIQLIAGLVLFSHVLPPPRPGEHLVELTLVETPEKPPEPPQPVPVVKLPPAPPVALPPPVIRIEAPKPRVIVPTPTPSPVVPTVAAPPPPPPPAQAAGIEDAFKAAVRAAIFAAHHVPESARLLAQFGETRVGFTLLDGHVDDVRITASSGHDTLDNAALAAVRMAHYPPVPEALRGRALKFEISLYHRKEG